MGFDPNQPGSMPNFGSYLGQGQNFSEMILDQLPGGGAQGGAHADPNYAGPSNREQFDAMIAGTWNPPEADGGPGAVQPGVGPSGEAQGPWLDAIRYGVDLDPSNPDSDARIQGAYDQGSPTEQATDLGFLTADVDEQGNPTGTHSFSDEVSGINQEMGRVFGEGTDEAHKFIGEMGGINEAMTADWKSQIPDNNERGFAKQSMNPEISQLGGGSNYDQFLAGLQHGTFGTDGFEAPNYTVTPGSQLGLAPGYSIVTRGHGAGGTTTDDYESQGWGQGWEGPGWEGQGIGGDTGMYDDTPLSSNMTNDGFAEQSLSPERAAFSSSSSGGADWGSELSELDNTYGGQNSPYNSGGSDWTPSEYGPETPYSPETKDWEKTEWQNYGSPGEEMMVYDPGAAADAHRGAKFTRTGSEVEDPYTGELYYEGDQPDGQWKFDPLGNLIQPNLGTFATGGGAVQGAQSAHYGDTGNWGQASDAQNRSPQYFFYGGSMTPSTMAESHPLS